MAHIVFFVMEYHPTPSANGICAKPLIDELQRRGHCVEVICGSKKQQYLFATQNNGVPIHSFPGILPKSFFKKAINKILSYPKLIFWPLHHPYRVVLIRKMFERIHKENPVDCIISVQMPAEMSAAGISILKKHPGIKGILYALDPISNNINVQDGIYRLLRGKSDRADVSYHRGYHHIFHMKFNKKYYYGHPLFKEFENKTTYLDLPLISRSTHELFLSLKKAKPQNAPLHFVYAGMLGVNFRDPSLLMKLLSALDTDRKILCDFYSRIDLKRFHCKEYTEHPDMFASHEYIPQSELNSVLANADFLLSIGNPHTETVFSLPSKIFMYMSAGKPIIHVLGGKNDVCIDYLKHYRSCLLIDPEDSFEENTEKLSNFIKDHIGDTVSVDEIADVFIENTPEWSVDKIESVL